VPKLWNETIAEHRQAVRDAAMDATAALVVEQGLTAVTMSGIAERTGIGRATLYKYFPDVDAVLIAWHERQIHHHLRHLVTVRDRSPEPGARLEAVLGAYALILQQHHAGPAAAQLHRGDHVVHAHRQLQDFVRELIAEQVTAGAVRRDVAADELARYCLHALSAAAELPSADAVHRLVSVVLTGLRAAD
jgi:AcrR family transcriptional regulator